MNAPWAASQTALNLQAPTRYMNWPHQESGYLKLRQSIASGHRRPVLQSPTGSGKSRLAFRVIEGALRKNNRVIFTCPRIDLIDKTMVELWDEGIRDCGVIQSDHAMTDFSQPVQVASVQTLMRRGLPEAAVGIVDECHEHFEWFETWFTDPAWVNKPIIGLSATPWRKGLGRYYDDLIVVAKTKELIESEKPVLSDFVVFGPKPPDLSNVKVVGGEFHQGEVSQVMRHGTITADIIETWKLLWGKSKTLFFGVDCAHAKGVQERFVQEGFNFAYQDSHTSQAERRELKRMFHNEEIMGICNVDTLTVGIDFDVRCISDGQANLSEMAFVQKFGRGLRRANGKDRLVYLDHVGNHVGRYDKRGKCTSLGFVTQIDERHDRLDTGNDELNSRMPSQSLPKACPQCTALRPVGAARCPHCGFEAAPHMNGSRLEVGGSLVAVDVSQASKKRAKKHEYTMAEKATFLAELKAYAAMKGRKNGWAAHSFKEKFAAWPHWSIKDIPAAKYPSAAVMQWVKSRNIAFAKSKKREDAHA